MVVHFPGVQGSLKILSENFKMYLDQDRRGRVPILVKIFPPLCSPKQELSG